MKKTSITNYLYENRSRIFYSALCTGVVMMHTHGVYAFDLDEFLKGFTKPIAKGITEYSTPIIGASSILGGLGAMSVGGGVDGRAVFGKVVAGVIVGALAATGIIKGTGLETLAQ